MPEFRHPPTVEVLQALVAPSPLHLNISRAVRLWYALDRIYNEFQQEKFIAKQWRNYLFLDPHSNWDKKANPIDNCICTKTIEHIIGAGVDWQKWRQSYLDLYSKNTEFNILQERLEAIASCKPFDVAQKTIKNDLNDLKDKSYLHFTDSMYILAEQIPELWTNTSSKTIDIEIQNNKSNPGLSEEFMSFSDTFWQPHNKIQRFHIHADYDCPYDVSLHVAQYRKKLAEIWNGDKGSPCKIIYKSSSISQVYSAIIYPVCIYYYQRAFYLCTFGSKQNELKSSWHNYRLDRLEKIESLDWESSLIPGDLREKCEQCDDNDLIYDDIYQGIADAYGFDINLPIKSMLLRFDRNFHDRYIANTLRHNTFRAVNYEEIDVLTQGLDSRQYQQIISRMKHYPDDAYYTMNYRSGDNSVIMRLLAWCPRVEVLSPLDLRDRMREDIQKTWELYS